MDIRLILKAHPALMEAQAIKKLLESSSIADDMATHQALTERYREKKASADHLYNLALAQLETVDDQRMRCILLYRYMMNLRWREVAGHLNDGSSTDAVKQAAHRYLRVHGGNNEPE